VFDCVYPLARDHLSFSELLPDYEPHKVREVYLVQWEQPPLVVDITDMMDLKLEAIRCHKSQVADFKAFETRMRKRAELLGQPNGYPTLRASTTSWFRTNPTERAGRVRARDGAHPTTVRDD
jgi:LmbE family N-acetylglucosaminyl deacetylase